MAYHILVKKINSLTKELHIKKKEIKVLQRALSKVNDKVDIFDELAFYKIKIDLFKAQIAIKKLSNTQSNLLYVLSINKTYYLASKPGGIKLEFQHDIIE